MLAERISRISLSPTIAVNTRARELRAQGVDVIDLSVGEPDFPTPDFVKDAAHRALDENQTRYTAAPGLAVMREAIVNRLQRDFGVTYSPDQVIACSGAKQALFNAILALVNEGDEVIVPSPYYVSYPSQIALAGGTVKVLETREEDHFLLRPEDLEAAIGPQSRLLILCNPNNPTGTAYDRERLLALCECAVSHGLMIVSDEIYEKILFDGRKHTCVATLSEAIKEKSIIINGLAKSHAMTGWRVGFAAAAQPIIGAMTKIQSQSTTHVCTISQLAGVAALDGPDDEIRIMVEEFERRRNVFSARLDAIPGFRCPEIHGTFYAFPNVEKALKPDSDQLKNTVDLALFLLEKARVAVVPGDAFGAPGYIRASFAASEDKLREAASRIEDALKNA